MEKHYSISKIQRESFFEMKQEHFHSYYEFYYLLSGNRKMFLDNKVYLVKPGDLILIPKGEIHRTTYYSEGIHERIALCFDDFMVENLKTQIGEGGFEECFSKRHISVPLNEQSQLEAIFEKLLIEKETENANDVFSQLLCQRYCEEIVMFIIRCQRRQEQVQGSPGFDMGIEAAAAYISNHYEQPLTLEYMANKYCMSTAYFSKKFKQVTGFGYKEFLNMVRIRHACELLQKTTKSVTQIALECGFMDSNYFGDAFRKTKGVSPRAFRKMSKQ